ncbi:MAG: 8-amino-7-oxononanoate synthase [Gammaproteobacteria bacterium]|nr:8-amino-7-oxononanoate synthase [Gammaproteobacteria bacterium]
MNQVFNLEQRLVENRKANLYRQRQIVEGPQGIEIQVDGQSFLNFSSNDYLGLANHPLLKQAMQQAVEHYGVGTGAAHLICGHSEAHHALEQELADWTGRERALLFSTGYMANLGVISALLSRSDAVFEDRLNHASLLDGGLLSGARFERYRHADCDDLQRRLDQSQANRKLVVTDAVFSMDGDIAPLQPLSRVCSQNNAWLMVDDAHGIGVLGQQGRGSLQLSGIDQQQAPVLMATLGKALGTFGAFVAGSEQFIEYLIQCARTYIYTTAMPAAIAEATRVSLELVQKEQWRRDRLTELITYFQSGLNQLGIQAPTSKTPIQPIILGDSERVLKMSNVLRDNGLWITAIRPPTVAKGTARLRVTLCSEHTEKHINRLLDCLNDNLQMLSSEVSG